MHEYLPKTLRQDLLRRRKEFVTGQHASIATERLIAQLKQFLDGLGYSLHSVALYYPIQHEIDLRPSMLQWASLTSGRKLALPVARLDKCLDFYEWQEGDRLIPSQHGVPEPDPSNPDRPALIPDCILIPCVGWSCSSEGKSVRFWRLGYGGGYFDRTLAQLRKNKPNLVCIGIGFEWQKLDDTQWSAQAHDEPLDMVITESEIYRS